MKQRIVLSPRVARVFTTPDELRALAGWMDAKWDRSLPGSDLVVDVWFGDDLLIEIGIDQTDMPRPSGSEVMR